MAQASLPVDLSQSFQSDRIGIIIKIHIRVYGYYLNRNGV
jgi:hypothetical protein